MDDQRHNTSSKEEILFRSLQSHLVSLQQLSPVPINRIKLLSFFWLLITFLFCLSVILFILVENFKRHFGSGLVVISLFYLAISIFVGYFILFKSMHSLSKKVRAHQNVIEEVQKEFHDLQQLKEKDSWNEKDRKKSYQGEVYHRVKNHFQILQSLLRLGSKNLTDEQKKPLSLTSLCISALARLYTQLHQNQNFEFVDSKDYFEATIRELIQEFSSNSQNIKINYQIESLDIPVKILVPLTLIIIELISNCYRHAFPDGKGEISFSLKTLDGKAQLDIFDTGTGFNPSALDHKKTFGLNLTRRLADQINARITFPNSGENHFKLNFEYH